MWGDLLHAVVLSVVSLAFLFALTKWMGNRQMSQLTMFDYITGISIGSVAAEMASHPEPESWLGLVVMGIFGAATLGINVLNDKSRRLRRFFLGDPTVLYDRGVLYYSSLKKARLDLTEFLTECRNAGYFDLSSLQMVVMELNGKLSFLPNEQSRPATPADMGLTPEQARPAVPVVMDGAVLPQRLKAVGLDEAWLNKQMRAQGYERASEILLATVDANNALAIYRKHEDGRPKGYYG